MTDSDYQKEIYRVYDKTNSNIFIKAAAGAGKTTTLVNLVKRTAPHKKIAFIAFNNTIVEEIKQRVNDERVKISTIHSIAYSILRKNIQANFKVVDNKSFILAKKILNLDRFKTQKEAYYYIFQICKLFDFCRLNMTFEKKEIENIASEYGVTILNGEVEDCIILSKEIEKYNKSNHKDFMIDFTDMVWLAYNMVKTEDYLKYSVVLVDETQDVSPLQRAFIERLGSKNGRFVFVGDDKQCIYQFIGSNLKSFKALQERPNTVTLPLSVTYRCSKAVVEEANSIFTGLEYPDNAIEGEVRDGSILEAQDGDYIICRNNLPLVQTFLELLKAKKKSHILGKDFGVSLITLINKLKKYLSFDEGFTQILLNEENKLIESGISNPKSSPKYGELFEKLQIVDILQKNFGGLDLLSDEIEKIFSENKTDGIILMTIHKSKGMEAKNVFLLGNDTLLPSKYAKSEEMLYAEQCLRYVSVTRAKESIIKVKLISKQ